jgi:hypothetical protein
MKRGARETWLLMIYVLVEIMLINISCTLLRESDEVVEF